jgi:hypothetical protein
MSIAPHLSSCAGPELALAAPPTCRLSGEPEVEQRNLADYDTALGLDGHGPHR